MLKNKKKYTTANIHHKVNQLQVNHKKQIETKLDEIRTLKQKLETIPTNVRWRIQERKSIVRRCEELASSIKKLEHRHQIALRSAMEMEEARRCGSMKIEAHIHELDPKEEDIVNFNRIEYTTCPDCGKLLEKLVDASVNICPACGVSSKYLETTRDGLAFNEDVEFVNTYQKKNHLQEWINNTQGRETAPIPKDVIDIIIQQLYDMGVRKSKNITRNILYEALKKLKLRKYYKNQTSILSQITGVKPKRILSHEEDQINLMFMILTPLYEKHMPEDRTNFQSYPYTLSKQCELLGMKWIRPYFKLLKGGNVLHKQDETWKKMCKETGWPFIPSI